ncbi:MFS transporter [Paenibacillus taihuensis]|nr:MFS transporter [Paenibacillus taihuensis]
MTTFLTYFYTDVAGVAAATVGTILLISRILDGVIDIGMGVAMDKTKSKRGKARLWLLWMAIPFAISAVLLFTMPDLGTTGKIIYIFITYNLVNIIYTSINMPCGALNSLITQNQYERSILNIFRMLMAMIGAIVVSTVTTPIVEALGDGRQGWQYTFMIYGAIAAVLFFITFRSTKAVPQ